MVERSLSAERSMIQLKKEGKMIHRDAIVETDQVGNGTSIWARTHVLKGAKIGSDCNIGELCYIENEVVIGDRVVIKNCVSVWDGVWIGNGVFIGPNVVMTNDLYPRAKKYLSNPQKTIINDGASIGANVTLLCNLTIGRYAMIGAGAVVTKSVADHRLVYGNPGKVVGWVCECGVQIKFSSEETSCGTCHKIFRKENGSIVNITNIKNSGGKQ